jgi:hypothetical protein
MAKEKISYTEAYVLMLTGKKEETMTWYYLKILREAVPYFTRQPKLTRKRKLFRRPGVIPKPVCIQKISSSAVLHLGKYMTDDQRFAARRPEVVLEQKHYWMIRLQVKF